ERGYHAMIESPEVGPRSSMMVSDAKMVVNWTNKGLRAAGTVEIGGLEAEPDWKRAEILRDHLFRMFPRLPKDIPASRIKMWMGHRPSMPDGKPCIGYSRASRDIVYAFGHGHVGLVGSARTGRLVAQLLSGTAPEIPLEPFAPTRFL
ncbi:MAG: NAD(P)/FAD-dependent oxidoreductase, partial [Candidatus Eiseniibacteriota bacterium]